MSDKRKDKFEKAAKSVASLVGAGTEPQSAIIKVARDESFTPEMTRRLCECFNLSQTYDRFRSFSDLDDKLASVPLVNAPETVKRAFGEEDREDLRKAASVDRSYARRLPDFTEPAPAASEGMEKAASAQEERQERLPRRRDLPGLYERARSLRGRAGRLTLEVRDNLRKVAKALKDSGQPFDEFEERILAKAGTEAESYLDALATGFPEQKRASVHDERIAFTDFSEEPYASALGGIELAGQVKEATDDWRDARSRLNEVADSVLKSASEDRLPRIVRWLQVRKFFGSDGIQKSAREALGLIGSGGLKKGAGQQQKQKKKTPAQKELEKKKTEYELSQLEDKQKVETGELQQKKRTQPMQKDIEFRELLDRWSNLGAEQQLGRQELLHQLSTLPAQQEIEADKLRREHSQMPIQRALESRELREQLKEKGLPGPRELAAKTRSQKWIGELMDLRTEPQEEVPLDLLDVFPPGHESQLSRVRTEAILSQIMANDPILREAQDETIEAFNMIRNFRPEVIESPATLHGLLRKMVEQSNVLEPTLSESLIAEKEGPPQEETETA